MFKQNVDIKWISTFLMCSVSAFFAAGCGSGTASDGTGSEVAVSTMSGTLQSSEGGIAINDGPRESRPIYASFLDGSILFPKAWAAATCGSVLTGATCSGSVMNMNFGGCTAGSSGATWSGNQAITFTNGSCSGNAATLNSIASAVTFTRRTIDSSSVANSVVRTAASGRIVTLTTEDTSGFATGKTGGAQIICGASGCSSTRTVTLKGIHLVGSAGLPWDHTISTDSDILVTGAGASRVVTGGVIRVQHNLAKFTSVSTINGPLNHTANCCFPVSGSVSTAFSGGKLDGKTETLTFSATCGQGTLTDSNNNSNALTLTHCL